MSERGPHTASSSRTSRSTSVPIWPHALSSRSASSEGHDEPNPLRFPPTGALSWSRQGGAVLLRGHVGAVAEVWPGNAALPWHWQMYCSVVVVAPRRMVLDVVLPGHLLQACDVMSSVGTTTMRQCEVAQSLARSGPTIAAEALGPIR